MLSFFSLNRISNAHSLFKNTLFVLYLPIFKDQPMSLLLILKKCYCSQRTFFFTEMRLHSSYFRLSYKVLFFKKWLFFLVFALRELMILYDWFNFTTYYNSETSSNISSWFNVWFSSYFTVSILHVPPYKM